jgi:hypothetical protein
LNSDPIKVGHAIALVAKNIVPVIAPNGDMIQSAFESTLGLRAIDRIRNRANGFLAVKSQMT